MNKRERMAKAKIDGKRGGLIGGPRRKLAIGPDKCAEIARVAAQARWAGHIKAAA